MELMMECDRVMKQEQKKARTAKTTTKVNFIVDAGIFTAFLVATAPRFSGIALHEWLGIAFGAAIVTHLLLHWQWIIATTRRFFNKAMQQQRINYVLNALLFIMMTVTIFSGLMISESALPLLGIRPAHAGIWRMLHSSSADATVFLIGLHVALHWHWIVSTLDRLLIKPVTIRLRSLRPVATAQNMSEI